METEAMKAQREVKNIQGSYTSHRGWKERLFGKNHVLQKIEGGKYRRSKDEDQ